MLEHAKGSAKENACYKMMLMTESKEKATLDFYKRAGYTMEDKTAFGYGWNKGCAPWRWQTRTIKASRIFTAEDRDAEKRKTYWIAGERRR